MTESILYIAGVLFVLWTTWTIHGLAARVKRMGRVAMYLEYELTALKHHQPTGKSREFADVAYELLAGRSVLDNPKTCAELLGDWGCSVSEFKEVTRRITAGQTPR